MFWNNVIVIEKLGFCVKSNIFLICWVIFSYLLCFFYKAELQYGKIPSLVEVCAPSDQATYNFVHTKIWLLQIQVRIECRDNAKNFPPYPIVDSPCPPFVNFVTWFLLDSYLGKKFFRHVQHLMGISTYQAWEKISPTLQ